jgi:HK97 family phage prohead protease
MEVHALVPIEDRVEASQLAIALCGYMVDGRAGWPPAFEDAVNEELESLSAVLVALKATRQEYEAAVELVRKIIATESFKNLQGAIARALSVVPRLEEEDIPTACRYPSRPGARAMQRLQLKATTTETTDQGTFTALVSAWNADREKDTILPTAFDKTIAAWRQSGKNLPLLFEHSTTTVGHIDPESMHATQQGLVVAGQVDRSTDEGQQVWRSIKSRTCGFSIGFAAESRPRKGGGRVLTEIDLLEISATSRPIHPDTRVLSMKSDREPVRIASFEC